MSEIIVVELHKLESPHDGWTLCPKKLFVFCENKGINRINGDITQVWQKAPKNRRRNRDNVREEEWKIFRDDEPINHDKEFVRMFGWEMDVN